MSRYLIETRSHGSAWEASCTVPTLADAVASVTGTIPSRVARCGAYGDEGIRVSPCDAEGNATGRPVIVAEVFLGAVAAQLVTVAHVFRADCPDCDGTGQVEGPAVCNVPPDRCCGGCFTSGPCPTCHPTETCPACVAEALNVDGPDAWGDEPSGIGGGQ